MSWTSGISSHTFFRYSWKWTACSGHNTCTLNGGIGRLVPTASAVENRFSNDYMSSEGVTDAERDEGMIVDAAKITTTHLLHM
jgi:hypothetical protein